MLGTSTTMITETTPSQTLPKFSSRSPKTFCEVYVHFHYFGLVMGGVHLLL